MKYLRIILQGKHAYAQSRDLIVHHYYNITSLMAIILHKNKCGDQHRMILYTNLQWRKFYSFLWGKKGLQFVVLKLMHCYSKLMIAVTEKIGSNNIARTDHTILKELCRRALYHCNKNPIQLPWSSWQLLLGKMDYFAVMP